MCPFPEKQCHRSIWTKVIKSWNTLESEDTRNFGRSKTKTKVQKISTYIRYWIHTKGHNSKDKYLYQILKFKVVFNLKAKKSNHYFSCSFFFSSSFVLFYFIFLMGGVGREGWGSNRSKPLFIQMQSGVSPSDLDRLNLLIA